MYNCFNSLWLRSDASSDSISSVETPLGCLVHHSFIAAVPPSLASSLSLSSTASTPQRSASLTSSLSSSTCSSSASWPAEQQYHLHHHLHHFCSTDSCSATVCSEVFHVFHKRAMKPGSAARAAKDAELIPQPQQQQLSDLRDIMRGKAQRHRDYYQQFYEADEDDDSSTRQRAQMSPRVSTQATTSHFRRTAAHDNALRHRRAGVYEMSSTPAPSARPMFKSVRKMREDYQRMLEETRRQLSATAVVRRRSSGDAAPSDDAARLIPPPSGYCSSTASGGNTSDDERCAATASPSGAHASVKRSGSSDSAVGGSDEEIGAAVFHGAPTASLSTGHAPGACAEYAGTLVESPYSPRGSLDHERVPSRILIEAQYVPVPLSPDRQFSVECEQSEDGDVLRADCDSRRQSCFTDDGEDPPKYKYWRTPSVVVSDYSDDVVGLTLDDIEYFRMQRKDLSSSPDSSLHSSCSNLNYCGSTISGLDSDYVRFPYRKHSAASICSSNCSGEEENDAPVENNLQPLRVEKPSAWRKLRNIVQWTPFFQTYKKQRYPWVQLAGHQGNFKAGPDQGTILKKLCEKEEKCFKVLMKDVLRPYVPEYKGVVTSDDGDSSYLQLQDLLGDFVSPCVMDCKIGVRTYLEEELAKAKEKPKLRKDMYEKMCQIDPMAPIDEEHRVKGVTKPRYMVWRETISSTETLGFRIEGIRRGDGTSTKDFKTTKTHEQVMQAFTDFAAGFPHALPKYIQRLKAIKATLESSSFFRTHEVIGSSLLFVHDRCNANVWLIDFAKTIPLPDSVAIDHNSKWKVGNHEDGYLIGVGNLISIFATVLEKQPVVAITPPLILPDSNDNTQVVTSAQTV